MTILADTVPEVVRLAHQVAKARVASVRADADAAQAMSDAQTARHHYEALKTELDALKEKK